MTNASEPTGGEAPPVPRPNPMLDPIIPATPNADDHPHHRATDVPAPPVAPGAS
jgi:hypothetical protein